MSHMLQMSESTKKIVHNEFHALMLYVYIILALLVLLSVMSILIFWYMPSAVYPVSRGSGPSDPNPGVSYVAPPVPQDDPVVRQVITIPRGKDASCLET